MSARGHEPRQSARGRTNQVGVVAGNPQYVGMGDYSRSASNDPADIVIFDLMLEDWLAKGFASDPAEAYGLRKERRAS